MSRSPEEWRTYTFGELLDIKSGFGFEKAEYSSSGIPLVKIDNVTYGHIKWDTVSYLPETYVDEYRDIVLSEGDILVALNRPITQGQLKIARLGPQDVPSILYQRVGKIIPINDELNYNFAFYLLQRELFFFVQRFAIGSDQPYISLTELRELPLALPPLAEQRRIAEILGTWDEAIALTGRLIDALRDRKKGLMQLLLSGEVRFPEFEDEEWKEIRLGEFASKVGSGITPLGGSKTYLSDGVPLIRSQNVLTGSLNLDDVAYISEEQHSLMSNTQLQPYDVLLNITGASIGRSCIVPADLDEGNVNQHVCIIRPTENLNPYYLCTFLNSEMGQRQIVQLQAGGNRQGLNYQQIRSFRVPLPSPDEQRRIADVFQCVDEEIGLLETYCDYLGEQKRGLMQQLLTGQIRVGV